MRERPHLADHGENGGERSLGWVGNIEGEVEDRSAVYDGVDCAEVISCPLIFSVDGVAPFLRVGKIASHAGGMVE